VALFPDPTGLAVVPWNPAKAYAVAAVWSHPFTPVWAWTPSASRWIRFPGTVATFEADPQRALIAVIQEELRTHDLDEDDLRCLATDALAHAVHEIPG